MEIERWIQYSVELYPNDPDGSTNYHGGRTLLRRFDLKRDLLEKYRWYMRYVAAYYQVRYPKHVIQATWCFYDKKTGLNIITGPMSKLISARRMITRCQNAIRRLREQSKGNLFENCFTEDPNYILLLDKLHRYEAEEKRLEEEINNLKK